MWGPEAKRRLRTAFNIEKSVECQEQLIKIKIKLNELRALVITIILIYILNKSTCNRIEL